jgi:curved DNA-binding protein CbpA
LGLTSCACESDIKRAYLKKAKETHPDSNPNDDDAHEKFQLVQWAFDRITNQAATKTEVCPGFYFAKHLNHLACH